MISLFIDTSLVNVSISIVKDGKILSLIQREIPNMHSIYATSFVKEVLDDAGISANQVDNIMVVNGPGSFTGVRIGVTIAKTYGYLINRDITLVSSLKALAISSNYDGVVMSVIPANKSSYYVGIYDKDYNVLCDEVNVSKDKLLNLKEEYDPYIIGSDDMIIGDNEINKINIDVLRVVEYYLDKDKVNCHMVVPNYLKLPQALEDKKC